VADNEEKLILTGDNSKLVSAVDQAVSKLRALDSAVGKTDKELRGHDRTVTQVANGLDRLVQAQNASATAATKTSVSYGRFGKVANETIQQLHKLEAAQDKYTASQIAAANLPTSLQGRGANGRFTQADATNLTNQQLSEVQALYKLQSSTLQSIVAEEVQRRNTLEQSVQAAKELKAQEQGSRGYANASTISDAAIDQRAKESRDFSAALRAQMQAQSGVDDATKKSTSTNKVWHENLNATRYALYDVSATLGIVGAAMVGLGVATYGTSISMERDFQAVVRTTGAAGVQIDYLRDQFVDLSKSIPVSFADLTDIGALGGQLGVAAKDLAGFTEVVAQFSATTDVSVDASATAFGRLDSLLPDVEGNYKALGSSILRVGVNSVATESAIINTAQQIASMAQIANISAPDIIGLAGALASLGIPPELSRSVITSTFTKIVGAVNAGGDSLEAFGSAAKMSGTEFAAAWKEDSIGTFQRLLQGINESDNAIGTLDGLGLASQRLTPTLLKLAQNTDLLSSTLADGNKGFDEATELQRQFGITSGTVSAKLQVLVQNFQAWLYEVGQGGNALGGLVDILTGLIGGLADLAKNPVANFFGQVTIGAVALVGVIALVAAGFARAAAGTLALSTALGVNTVAVTGNTLSFGAQIAAMTAAGGAAKAAAVGIRILGGAMKAITLIGAAVVLGELGSAALTAGLEASGAAVNVDKLATTLAGAGDISKKLKSELGRTGNIFGRMEDIPTDVIAQKLKSLGNAANGFEKGWIAGWDGTTQTVKQNADKIDDAITKMIAAGNVKEAQAAIKAFGDQWNLTGPQVKMLLDNSTDALKTYKAGLNETEVAEQKALDATEAYAMGIGMTAEQMNTFSTDLATAGGGFFAFSDLIGQATDEAGFHLKTFNDSLQAQIDALTNWETNLGTLVEKGVSADVIGQLARLGPEGAPLIQAAVDDWDTEGQRLVGLFEQTGGASMDAMAQGVLAKFPGIQGSLAANPLIIQADAAKADTALEVFRQRIYSTTGFVNVDANTGPAMSKLAILRSAIYNTNSMVSSSIARVPGGYTGGLLNATWQKNAPKADIPGYARGGGPGRFKGPGSGTSDSILARVSNGEYINTAATVRHYGADFFDALNRRQVPKFAEGGNVGGGAAPAQVVAHLSPRDRAMAGQKSDIVIQIDGREVFRAVQNASNNAASTGTE
jgi:TP901 family phage tail tape measure protein